MAEQARGHRHSLWAILLLAGVVLGTFGDVLFVADPPVLSSVGGDLWREFIFWRDFGFSELAQGNLALWNPYVFCGVPFFGGFQSALLYPPNWLHLIVPLVPAINWGIALHFFLAGLFTYLWTGHRGLSRPARALSAILFIFCGPYYLHLYPGHIMSLPAVAWAPLIMLCVDKLFDERRPLRWSLIGMAAVAMQILAGHPQTVYYTAVVAGLFAMIRAIGCRKILRAEKGYGIRVAAGFVGFFAGAAALTAVQLFTGIDAAGESVRGPGVPYEFAALFSFPPENFLTLLVPGFFGELAAGFGTEQPQAYWGRCYLWEMCAFFSVTGLWLAIYGAWSGERASRRSLLAMSLICLLLALGSRTPLFDLLYRVVPGWDKFRGNSKFIVQFALFATLLAGVGLDRILAGRVANGRRDRRLTGICAVSLLCGIVLLIGAGSMRRFVEPTENRTVWRETMRGMLESGESYLDARAYEHPEFIAESARFASGGLLLAGLTGILAGGLMYWASRRPRVAYALAVLAVAEILVFARSERATFDLQTTRLPVALETYFAEETDDGRLFWPDGRIVGLAQHTYDNQGMIYGVGNLWGDDPGVPLRYAQFMTWTQGGEPDEASQYLAFGRFDPLYAMLRTRTFMSGTPATKLAIDPVVEAGGLRLYEQSGALPRGLLIENYRVIKERDAIFAAMRRNGFDPRREIILEQEPKMGILAPDSSDAAGVVEVTAISTDELEVRAELSRPAILLLTEGYHSGWRVRAEAGSAQDDYEVLPANYVLVAVPLQAGSHTFRLEYSPLSFRAGVWVTGVSLAAYLGCWAVVWRRGRAHG